jgi:cytochrome b561
MHPTVSLMKTESKLPSSTKPRLNSAFLKLMSLHWWMARLYVLLLSGGWLMVRLPDRTPLLDRLYDVHQSAGILTIALLSWRILVLLQVWWRKYTKRLPKFTGSWLRAVALHTLLYAFMWAVPITGVFLSETDRANDLRLFGLSLPDLFPQNLALVAVARSLHFWLAYIFLVFIILHLIAQWKVVRAHWRQVQKWIQHRYSRRLP